MTRHLLDVTDFSVDEIVEILDLSEAPIDSLGAPLERSGASLIFEKPSNRTRHSMQMAVVQLGGHPIYTRGDEVGFDTREPVEDVVRIMAGYHAVIAARVFEHSTVERAAAAMDADGTGVPIVNMLSEWSHPLQAFADALTMRQCLGDLTGRTVAYVGDYANVARSLAEISLLLGMRVRLACPAGFDANEAELERLSMIGAGDITQMRRPIDAVDGADAVHTDTWVSMGQESEKHARRRAFESYTVDDTVMSAAADDAIFMHCLPAYRGFEVSADVIDGPASVVFQQGHNRMHAARGALAFVVRETHA
ncbi:MAG: ornithine carbamoyltransferase [Ilumatobacter sp.]